MIENLDSQLEIDRQKIRNSISLQSPVEVTSYTLPRNMEVYCRKILNIFLEECHQEHMKEYLDFCLGELLTNAKKANTKRIYFKEKNLNIYDPEDYQLGMKTFKDDTLSNIDYYLDLQRKQGLYIKLLLQLTDENIKIEIRNNSRITPFEKERIDARIENALKFKSPEDIIANILDQTEGAGLGIMIIILMLQKIGLEKDCYQVRFTEDETITSIVLPCNKVLFAGIEAMSYEFMYLQKGVPVLRERYNKLAAMIPMTESIDRKRLLSFISNDVSFTILLLNETLKRDKECLDIEKALSMLTDEEIRFIYSELNENFLFIENEKEENETLWNHASKVALYSFNLWKNFMNADDEDARKLYTMGLMNSIGKIFLENESEEQKDCMQELSAQYEEAQKIMDLFQSGSSSPYLSYIYAKIHGFPKDLCYVLGKWNAFEDVQKEKADLISVVYLAECIAYYNEGILDFYQIKTSILDTFNIKTEIQFANIANMLKAA